MNNYIKNTNEDEFYHIYMADMICHKVYELLMSILRMISTPHLLKMSVSTSHDLVLSIHNNGKSYLGNVCEATFTQGLHYTG
jgi:hypothetical protein